MQSGQVKSRQRVSDHGEVYTNLREVDAMLDLVRNETERIDSRFLEPACGHGNFLTAILTRKLDAVEKKYRRSRPEFEAQALLGLACIYGIDKLEDNVKEARARLVAIFEDRYREIFKDSIDSRVLDSARYLLQKNIIYGDALTLRTIQDEPVQSEQNGRPTLDSLRNEAPPIIFSQWSLIDSARFKRHDYLFEHLVNRVSDGALFAHLGEDGFIPKSLGDGFPLVHYLEISHAFDEPVQS